MRSCQIRWQDSHAHAAVEAAERGEATMITKHGRPPAVIVPVETARDLLAAKPQTSFASHLLALPSEEFERIPGTLRDVEL